MMQWDDRKGKYIKPFSKKKRELLPHLYLEGFKLYWNFPKKIEVLELSDKHAANFDNDPEQKGFMKDFEEAVKSNAKWKKYRKQQKYLNMVLSVLPYIPLTGLVLGVIL